MKYLAVSLILILGFLVKASPEQKVVFLDVGQGDSILMQDGAVQVLVDGGPGMKVLEELGEQMPWFDRRIEVIVLTHPQRDHMEGLLYVLDRYDVGLVLIPKVATKILMQEKWLEKIEQTGTSWRFAWAGQKIEVEGMTIRVLSPDEQALSTNNVNDASVVMRIDFNDLSFLLTGDAEKKIENRLASVWTGSDFSSNDVLDVDVLKVGHHGSKTSSTQNFLRAVAPQAAIISVGADNKFGHPSDVVLKRLRNIPIWRTDRDGAVKFSYVDGRWLVGSER